MEEILGVAANGVVGTITGVIGGLVGGFLKYKTLKETNQHNFRMAELAGQQEVERAKAELQQTHAEGDIKRDLAAEESLQASYAHDSAIGEWLAGQKLGPVSMGIMVATEAIRKLMRPVLTVTAVSYVLHMYGENVLSLGKVGAQQAFLQDEISGLSLTITNLAALAFGWWFADRSLQKPLRGNICAGNGG